ncbi:MAG: Wzz/FepE/Etk N-terminal domain-containing protein [Syntrophomonadaceae bacterium]|jgi:capsular polysaccharide biosynthesis protein|nr:Wzz/FepE/Etk N-terminal domain-containing protein [Syntrophomonadaceae bacterium]MDH7497589.1 Wzz/FepE/Etk N-terminal domain-containing protein [Syntrophomonadaceae bacterium]
MEHDNHPISQERGYPVNTGNDPLPYDDYIDLRALVQVLSKRRRLIAAGTLLAVLTAAVLSFFVLPPVYEAQALLLVTQPTQQQAAPSEDGVEGSLAPLTRIPVQTMSTYLGQLKSQAVLRRTIAALELDPRLYTPESLGQMVTATVQKDSNLIDLRVQNSDPRLAARIANTMCDQYFALLSEKNQQQMTRSVQFLQEQRKATEAQLAEAIARLKAFQAQPRGVAVLEAEFNLLAGSAGSYASQREEARRQLEAARAGLARLEADLAQTPALIEVAGAEGVSEQPNPVYQALAQQVAAQRAQVAASEAALRGAESGSRTADLDRLAAELTAKRAQQSQLQAEVDRLNETLNTLARKITETQITRSLDLGQTAVALVSDAAVPESPVKPRKTLNMAVALLLGLMASVALAFALEHLDQTVKTPEDVVEHLGLPVLGLVPQAGNGGSRNGYGGY